MDSGVAGAQAAEKDLVLGGLTQLSLTSALPSLSPILPVASSFLSYPPQVSPVAVLTGGCEHREGDADTHGMQREMTERPPPKPSPSTHRSPPPTGRAAVLTGDFEGTIELPPEPLQSGHRLQEKGSSLPWGRGREDRGPLRGHHFESSSLETLVVPRLNAVPRALAGTD